MQVVWLAPLAAIGLIGLVAPVLVHLLTRHRRRQAPFPSLRFLEAASPLARGRRRVSDWPLLLLRAAIIAAAAAALAGPVVMSAARLRQWDARIVRAVVFVDGSRPAAEIGAGAFRIREFRATGLVGDAVRAAVAWLRTEPPGARELVLAGDLREGMVSDADIGAIPQHVGIRFLPDGPADEADAVELPWPVVGGGESIGVRADAQRTQVTYRGGGMPGATDSVRVEVRVDGEARSVVAEAFASVLADRLVTPPGARRDVLIDWSSAVAKGAPPERPAGWMARAMERLPPDYLVTAEESRLVVRPPGPPAAEQARRAIRTVIRAVVDEDLTNLEPGRVSPARLVAWARAPGKSPAAAAVEDEGDRRWLWGLVLVLLGVETWMRRPRRGDA